MKDKGGDKVVATDASGKKFAAGPAPPPDMEAKGTKVVGEEKPAVGPAPPADKGARGVEAVGGENSAVGPVPPPDKEAKGMAAAGADNSVVGPAPPLDKEASAIAGQQGGEGLGGCGRRELCYGAGAGKKNPWPSNLPHAVLRARHHAPRGGSGWRRIHVHRAL